MSDLNSLFQARMAPQDNLHGQGILEGIQYAAAALLIICARADFEEHPSELMAISELLHSTFTLPGSDIDELMSLAGEEAGKKGLEQFTELVNEHYDDDDKSVLLESLWQVAFADQRIDKYEEQYIARLAFMIDIPQDKMLSIRASVQARTPTTTFVKG